MSIHYHRTNTILLLFFAIYFLLVGSILLRPPLTVKNMSEEAGKTRPNISTFIDSHYYINRNGAPFAYLNSNRMDLDHNKDVAYLTSPSGHVYTSEIEITNYQGKKGFAHLKNNIIELSENVKINNPQSELLADKAVYNKKNALFTATGNVRSQHKVVKSNDLLKINADRAEYWPQIKESKYYDHVNGEIIRGLVYEPPVFFKANYLFASSPRAIINLDGDVWLKRQNVEAWSLRGDIFLENANKNVRYYVLYDDVRLREQFQNHNGADVERKSFSEKLEGFTAEQKIVLSGYPKVIQGKDIIKGNTIIFYESNELVEVNDSSSSFEVKENEK